MSVHGFGTTVPERRRAQRTNLDEIVYVDMGPENGGVVLNVSEGGLAFCAAVPIRQPGVIQFSLLVKGKGRVASSADIVWIDKRRKTCGLRFTPSFEDSGVRLQHWTDASYCPSMSWSRTSPSNRPVETPAAAAGTGVSAHPRSTELVAASPALPASKPERGPFDPITAEDLAKTPLGMSSAAVAVLCATAAIFLVAGLLLAASAYGKRGEDLHFESAVRSDANATLRSDARGLKSPAPEPGHTELAAALEFLRAPSQPDTTSATRLLQSAVKSGNSSAGVFLAEMYLSGEGVRKNCTDAGALLTAASRNGNIEASVKLKELVVKGCR
jgi:PilZ domain-containing protein